MKTENNIDQTQPFPEPDVTSPHSNTSKKNDLRKITEDVCIRVEFIVVRVALLFLLLYEVLNFIHSKMTFNS
jgi:hypothetical protein